MGRSGKVNRIVRRPADAFPASHLPQRLIPPSSRQDPAHQRLFNAKTRRIGRAELAGRAMPCLRWHAPIFYRPLGSLLVQNRAHSGGAAGFRPSYSARAMNIPVSDLISPKWLGIAAV